MRKTRQVLLVGGFFPPIWKICSWIGISSPSRGEDFKQLKPPPSICIYGYNAYILVGISSIQINHFPAGLYGSRHICYPSGKISHLWTRKIIFTLPFQGICKFQGVYIFTEIMHFGFLKPFLRTGMTSASVYIKSFLSVCDPLLFYITSREWSFVGLEIAGYVQGWNLFFFLILSQQASISP